MVSRRVVLGAGLGGLALVGSAGVWRVMRTPQTAMEPWALASPPPDDVRLDAFRHAILAPNPHNRQPWLIRLVGADQALVYCDLDKRLPETDPFDRQITIGFGAFFELARIAAAQRGVAMDMVLFPDGEAQPRLNDRPVARLTFMAAPDTARDDLFAAIPLRRSNKEVYDESRALSSELLAQVAADGGQYSVQPTVIAEMREHIVQGILVEMTTPAAYMESVDLMRIGYDQVDANPDGITLTGPMIEAGKLTGQINREQLSDIDSQASKIGRDQLAETYGSIPALFWITTSSNTRADQIEAGRQYVRANLRATALGLAMHPMSQTLQEYQEVASHYQAVHQKLGIMAGGDESGNESGGADHRADHRADGGTDNGAKGTATGRVQMLARVGYGPEIGASPRWPLDTHIMTAQNLTKN